MDPNEERHFSFPNADQAIPGVTDENRPQPESSAPLRRPTVNIIDVLNSQKKEEGDLQKIHTFQGDMASAIKDDNLSMIKVALAEKKRQERQGGPIEFEESNSKKYIIMGAVAVVALILLAGIYFYISISLSKNTNTPTEQAAAAPLLYTEQNSVISVDQKDSNDVTRLLKRELDKPLDLGSMRSLTLVLGTGTSTREITTEELLKGLQTRASDSLIRSLDPSFLLGLYSFSPDDFFLLLKVNSYDTAFASMLQWEPDMENDIGDIFITTKPVLPITDAISTDATTTTSPAFSNGKVWVDRVVNNKDARVLTDSDGKINMLYTFLDKQTLVIASSDKALKEIMFRLTAGRIVR